MSLDNMTLDEVKFWSKGCKEVLLAIEKDGLWRCPECLHLMCHPPIDYHICSVCRTEFGYGAEERPGSKPLWEPSSEPAPAPQPQAPESLMVERHDYREDTYAIGSDYRPQPQAGNEQFVGTCGDKIVVVHPLREMSHDQALMLAAYLVSTVGDDQRWEETLKAVQNKKRR